MSRRTLGVVLGLIDHRANEVEDSSPNLAALDPGEQGGELDAFPRHQEVVNRDFLTGVLEQLAGSGRRIRQSFEEIADAALKRLGDFIELAGRDAVRTAFVLLDLLEGQAQIVGQAFLADAEHLAAKADLAADVQVDRVRFPVIIQLRRIERSGRCFGDQVWLKSSRGHVALH